MPITYDVETDYLYKKGTEKGTKIGIVKGIEIEKIDVICQLRQEGSSIEYIAKIVRLSPEQVRQILDNLKIK
jgi:predicted transposase YdaD